MTTGNRIQNLPRPFSIFREFTRLAAAGSILLLLATVGAFVWANSPWSESYAALWDVHLRIGVEAFAIDESLLHWINDGLMVLFFFLVGLEIKRELIAGELSTPRKAALPIAAAIGGMVVPALIYLALNPTGETARGWGVPMATDIAFALAVLTALGSRAPTSLKVFLTALAIIDDLGAILVIALFYSEGVVPAWLGLGGILLLAMVGLNLLHVRSPIPYALLGVVVWVAFLESGIHATVAGVLAAMTIPARRRIDSREFLERGRRLLEEFDEASEFRGKRLIGQAQQEAIHRLESSCEAVATPLSRMEHKLHPWVTFLILPLFALANAGVTIQGGTLFVPGLTLGIVFGLLFGKQLGITLFAWFAVRLGLASLPEDVRWTHVYATAWLGGIGFTMSLFIAGLAFTTPALLDASKLAILTASILSGVGGWLLLVGASRKRSTAPEPGSAPEQSAPHV